MPNAGDFRSQVVFQLTAAELNCVANGNLPDCSNDSLFKAAVAACYAGAACAPSTAANKAAQTACVNALDCLNNGGHIAADGTCAAGTCSDNGAACSSGNLTNCGSLAATCNDSNCHQQNFGNFPDSPAGSQKACQDANKNSCDIFTAANTTTCVNP
jgi:hypothetical protein